MKGKLPTAGIAGVGLVGGDKKSYYLKLGTDAAFLLKKRHYDDEFNLVFKGCPELIEKYGDNPRWADFEKHIYEYAEICK